MSFKTDLYRVDPDTGDILPTAKKTLADYLSRRTSKASTGNEPTGTGGVYTYTPPSANAFPISSPSDPPLEASTGITDPARNSQPAFAPAAEDLLRWGPSGEFDKSQVYQPNTTPAERNRTLADVDPAGASSNPTTAELQRQVSVNLGRNRFSSGRGFTRGETTNPRVSAAFEGSPAPPSDAAGGTRKIVRGGTTTEYSSLYDEMRNEAIRALILATGETPIEPGGATTVGDVEGPSPVQGNADTVSALGLTKVDTNGLKPERVELYNRLSQSPLDAEELPGVSSESKYTQFSHGNLNSFLEPFNGVFPSSTVSQAGILLVAAISAVLATEQVAEILNKYSTALPKKNLNQGDIGPYGAQRGDVPFGAGLGIKTPESEVDLFNKLLGLIRPYGTTKNPEYSYFEVALSGVATFAGLNPDGQALSESEVKNLLQSDPKFTNTVIGGPGYYVVMVRNIVRSLEVLGANSFGDIGADGTASSDSLAATAGLVSRLRDSKLIRFVDTMARLGVVQQMTLAREAENRLTQPLPKDSSEESASTLEEAAVIAKGRVGRGREVQGSRQLAYSFRTAANSSYNLLPKSFKYSSVAYSNSDEKISNVSQKLGVKYNRAKDFDITPEMVQQLEDRLEAEYVPFYLHDLRTNEILNFHAFIENVTDGYTANYNAVDSYGRMDPVQIYKNTTRAIGVDFMIVATSPDDFDRMWWTINRLTMMVYPQWSSGEELQGVASNGETYSFIQPFSQVPTSSPLIRLRLGELIHSNYSRFNLARIFGLGGNSSTTGGRHFVPASEEGNSVKIETLASRNPDFVFEIKGGDTVDTLTARYNNIPVNVKVSSTYEASDEFGEIAGSGTQSAYRVFVEKGTTARIVGFKETGVLIQAVLKLSEPIPESTELIPMSYISVVASASTIEPTSSFLAAVTSTTNSSLTDDSEQLSTTTVVSENFGTPGQVRSTVATNNIVRSFESAGGRGLAGVITALNYTWYDDNTVWEIDQGSRAPMMCKVSISFSPIHDIPMGLDSEGIARSVPYPVGGIVRQAFFPELHENDKVVKSKLKK